MKCLLLFTDSIYITHYHGNFIDFYIQFKLFHSTFTLSKCQSCIMISYTVDSQSRMNPSYLPKHFLIVIVFAPIVNGSSCGPIQGDGFCDDETNSSTCDYDGGRFFGTYFICRIFNVF